MHEGGSDLMAANQICVTDAGLAAVRLVTRFSLDQMLVSFHARQLRKADPSAEKNSM